MERINGWVSNLTKNTASLRVNFKVEVDNAEVEQFCYHLLMKELDRARRTSEANEALWTLKAPIEREYPMGGKSSARIRFRKV